MYFLFISRSFGSCAQKKKNRFLFSLRFFLRFFFIFLFSRRCCGVYSSSLHSLLRMIQKWDFCHQRDDPKKVWSCWLRANGGGEHSRERVFLMDNECHSLSNIVFTDFKISIIPARSSPVHSWSCFVFVQALFECFARAEGKWDVVLNFRLRKKTKFSIQNNIS